MSESMLGQCGRSFRWVINGNQILFWTDNWVNSCTLFSVFTQLFSIYICTNPNVTLQEVCVAQGKNIKLKRVLHGVLLQDFSGTA